MKRYKSYLKNAYSAEYNALKNAIHRCHNPKNLGYLNYGVRGITVFDAWRSERGFELFLDYMGPRPSPQHSLDRIDNDGPYAPGNVWWAPSAAVQLANRRPQKTNCGDLGWGVGYVEPTGTGRGHSRKRSALLPHDGRVQTVAAWSIETTVSGATIISRIRRGLSPAEALNPSTSRRGEVRKTPRNAHLLSTIH